MPDFCVDLIRMRAALAFPLRSGRLTQVNDWMEDLLITSSEDLYRFKGVLAIDGWPDRFIFQVCMQPVSQSIAPFPAA